MHTTCILKSLRNSISQLLKFLDSTYFRNFRRKHRKSPMKKCILCDSLSGKKCTPVKWVVLIEILNWFEEFLIFERRRIGAFRKSTFQSDRLNSTRFFTSSRVGGTKINENVLFSAQNQKLYCVHPELKVQSDSFFWEVWYQNTSQNPQMLATCVFFRRNWYRTCTGVFGYDRFWKNTFSSNGPFSANIHSFH